MDNFNEWRNNFLGKLLSNSPVDLLSREGQHVNQLKLAKIKQVNSLCNRESQFSKKKAENKIQN